MQIYIFRHGETDWNAEKRIQGHIDTPLNAKGREQARELAMRLKVYDIQAIVSSDLARARETANIIANSLGTPFSTDRRFRELSLGEVEGLLINEVIARFGEATWQKWRSMKDGDLDFGFPGGEVKREALARVRSALIDCIEKQQFERIGVAAHGMVMRLLVHSLLPPESEAIPVHNCAVHLIQVDRASPITLRYIPM